ncbi:hypothetical protein JTE90_001193 [Oedothorax gibbosus]|uniref:Uncharacterized protein n=1 Tax=Oedothorax gibbosus TaxID=931172 RepID=A0AAV6UUI0_9ARAC|nr:hypothetical protein JTE90_001193 [Oedothorax gibbosus]
MYPKASPNNGSLSANVNQSNLPPSYNKAMYRAKTPQPDSSQSRPFQTPQSIAYKRSPKTPCGGPLLIPSTVHCNGQ